ncbi:MAG: hypothetical protein AAF376_14490 [Pseudomonadota bacterium]
MKQAWILVSALVLAGCGDRLATGGGGLFEDPDAAPEEVIQPVERPTEEAEAAGGGFLGFTVASLGDASDPGLWLETPLVDEERPGRVINERGQVLTVTLRPSGGERGSGSRMSLEAFQALSIPLTALPTVTVSGG